MAANLYWLTFRLEQNATWQRRYDALTTAINDSMSAPVWWDEPTSFRLFKSELSIDELAKIVGGAIDRGTDVALLGMPDYKSARTVGRLRDRDIFKLWDWVQET